MGAGHKQLLVCILLGLFTILVLLPNTVIWRYPPDRDQALFLYVAQQILDGGIPYRDVWDHKGPVVYYIDALGLFLAGGSVWGVWIIEFLSLWFTALIGFALMQRSLGTGSSLWASSLWLISLIRIMKSGNMTEEFALPLQFLALYLFYQSETGRHTLWRNLLFGLTAAVAFLLRPNLIGVHLAVIFYLIVRHGLGGRWRLLASTLSGIALGGCGALFLVSLYFAAHHALGFFWDCVFRYNFAYLGTTNWQDLIQTFVYGVQRLDILSGVALAGWIAGIYRVWRSQLQPKQQPLVALSVISFPFVLYLSIMSGRPYRHYYIAWLPMMGILACIYASCCIEWLVRLRPLLSGGRFRTAASACLLLLFLGTPLPFLGSQIIRAYDKAIEMQAQKIDQQIAAELLMQVTDESDYVLVWGAETAIHFASRRRSPTRFVYQYPLYTPGYQTDEMIEEFLLELNSRKPKIIIDTSSTEPTIPPLKARITTWSHMWYQALPSMQQVYEYIHSHYCPAGQIGRNGWLLYKQCQPGEN